TEERPMRHPARRGGQPGGPGRTTGIGARLETGTARSFRPSTPRTRVTMRGRRTAMVHDAARRARSDREAEPTARPGLPLSRRRFLALGGVAGLGALLAACGGAAATPTTAPAAPSPTTAAAAGASPTARAGGAG